MGVNLSIGTLDEEVWRLTEPGTPPPRRRLEAVRRLNEAGVACGVLVAPIIPGLSDRPEQVDEVVAGCVEAGAVSISSVALHLRRGVREHYLGWLAGARPDLVDEYRRRYRRSYLPAEEQAALAAQVRSSVARARRQAGISPGWPVPPTIRPDTPAAGPPPADPVAPRGVTCWVTTHAEPDSLIEFSPCARRGGGAPRWRRGGSRGESIRFSLGRAGP